MNRPSSSARLRVLFVCALNQWRSPTAEHLYRDDSRLEVRSAGIRTEANRYLSEKDLEWAEIVFTMDREQKNWIVAKFRYMELPRIVALDISDKYQYMDPRLQEALRLSIDPELAALFKEGEEGEGTL